MSIMMVLETKLSHDLILYLLFLKNTFIILLSLSFVYFPTKLGANYYLAVKER